MALLAFQKPDKVIMLEADGTPNKERFGANAILGVSMAFAKASAMEEGIPLYKYLGIEFLHRLPNLLI